MTSKIQSSSAAPVYLRQIDKGILSKYNNLNEISNLSKDELNKLANDLKQTRIRILKGKIVAANIEYVAFIKAFNNLSNAVNAQLGPDAPISLLPDLEDFSKESVLQYLKSDENFIAEPTNVQNFIQNLTLKNLGHLVGDSYILGMVDQHGFPLEGNSTADSMEYTIHSLKYLKEAHPELLAGNEKNIARILNILEASLPLFKKFKSLRNNPHTSEFDIQNFALEVQKKLEQLPEAGEILLPFGWGDPSGKGHGMLQYVMKHKGDLLLDVLNTGSGIEYHDNPSPNESQAKIPVNTVQHYLVPKAEIESFYQDTLQALFEPGILGIKDDFNSVMYGNQRYSAVELYMMLQKYRIAGDKVLKSYQLNGTCSFQIILSFMDLISKSTLHKDVKFVWETDTVKYLIKYKDVLLSIHPNYHIILSRTLSNLYRHVEKLQNAGLPEAECLKYLEQFADWQKQVDELYITPVSHNPKPALDRPISWEDPVQDRENIADRIDALSNKDLSELQRSDQKSSTPYVEFTKLHENVDILAEIESNLERYNERIDSLPGHNPWISLSDPSLFRDFQLIEDMRSVSDLFFNPSKKHLRENVIIHLRNNPEKLDKAITTLGKLIEIAGSKPMINVELGEIVYLEGIRLAIWDLAVLRDDINQLKGDHRLDQFRLNYKNLQEIENLPPALVNFYDNQIEEDFRYILEGYRTRFAGSKRALFDLDRNNPYSNIYIRYDPNDPEMIYVKNHLSELSEKDLKNAHEDYLKFIQEEHSNDKTENDWLVFWAFVNNKTPVHFNILKKSSYDVSALNLTSRFSKGIEYDYKNIINQNFTFQYSLPYHISAIPKYSEESLFRAILPNESGKVSNQNKYSDIESYKLPLYSLDQNKNLNELISKWQGPASVESISHPLNLALLLDFYRKSPELLAEPEHQALFHMLISSPFKMTKVIKEHPQLAADFVKFFEEVSTLIKSGNIRLSDPSQIHEYYSYIARMKANFYLKLDFAGISIGKELLHDLRKDLQKERVKPEIQGSELEILFLIPLIESFGTKGNWGQNELPFILDAYRQLQVLSTSNEPNVKLSSIIPTHCLRIIVKHKEDIEKWLSTSQGYQWIQSIVKDNQVLNWKLSPFPVLKIETKDGIRELNILNGESNTGKTLVPWYFLKNEEYLQIFGKKSVSAVRTEDNGYIIETSQSKYILQERWDEIYGPIQRIQNNTHYISVERSKVKFLNEIPTSSDWILWANIDKNRSEIIIENRKGEVLGIITSEGHITLNGPPARSYQYSDKNDWEIPLFNIANLIHIKETNEQGITLERVVVKNLHDENGTPLEFFKSDNKWNYKNDSDFFISDKQFVNGFKEHNKFLVLENSRGTKIALLPNCSQSELKNSLNNDKLYISVSLNANNELDLQSSPFQNMSLAYHLLQEARNPEDYSKILDFMNASREFRQYTPNELKVLGLIIFSNDERKNDDPEAFALRLYAAYLIYDNIKNYPLIEPIVGDELVKPSYFDQPEKWNSYLRNHTLNPIEGSILEKIATEYFWRKNNLPNKYKLDKLLSKRELVDWGLAPIQRTLNSKLQHNHIKIIPKFSITFYRFASISSTLLVEKLDQDYFKKIRLTPLFTRQGKSFQDYFRFLIQLANSDIIHYRERIRSLLLKAQFDNYKDNPEKVSYLVLILYRKEKSQLGRSADKILKLLESKDKEYIEFDREEDLNNEYDNFYKLYTPAEQGKNLFSYTDKPKPSPQSLPSEPNKTDLVYKPSNTLHLTFENLYKNYFLPRPMTQDKPKELFNEVTPEVGKLNEEYVTGYQQNLQKKSVNVKADIAEVKSKLLQLEKINIEQLITQDSSKLTDLKQEIEKIGNRELTGSIKGRMKVGGKKKYLLKLDDLIFLFLKRDSKQIAKATLIKEKKDQQALLNLIGKYLETEMSLRHSQSVLKSIQELENSPEALGQIQDLLENPPALVKHENIFIQLVFQHFLNMNMRPDQVSSMNKMTNSELNTFVQRATGAGKTLFFAQLLAYYKSDGYHLSIHVSPEYQYSSLVYEMGDRSLRTLNQKQYTLEFYDSPAYFNEKFLRRLKEQFVEVITQGGFFHTVNTTLRTLRTAYVHSALEYHNSKSLSTEGKDALGTKKDLVCNINATLRERGLMTYDEVHDAKNPKKILHKGVGDVKSLDSVHLELLSLMLRLSIEPAPSGKPLVGLKENSQSQMTAEEKLLLTTRLVDYLTSNPDWLKNFDCENLSESQIHALRKFLTDKEAPIPDFTQSRIKGFVRIGTTMTPLDHLLLCRQLIAGKWLFDALSKTVYEHHGIVYQSNKLPISIPFTSNLTPSWNSEFSDPYRMGLNTFIAYHVQGISEQQTIELIEYLKKLALIEFEEGIESDPTFRLEQTDAYRKFQKILDKSNIHSSLFDIKVQNQKERLQLRQALQSTDKDALLIFSNYISARILQKKSLHTEQVSCNAMNTATIGKRITGFAATIDNLHIAPVMDFKGQQTTVETEKGVFGQRIDRLISKHNNVYIMGNEPEDLFKDVYHNLPIDKQQRVRAVIDSGCHFAGVENIDVAKMMCKAFKKNNAPVTGVIFYESASDKPYFMPIDNTAAIRPVHSFRTKIDKKTDARIFADLNIPVDNVAVYFNQSKTTATNIPLQHNAVALSTVTESTQFFNKFQGDGRMREEDKQQEIIHAVQNGSLPAIAQAIQKPTIAKTKLGVGKVEGTQLVKDIILFTFLERNKELRPETFLFCMQNLQNTVQQYLLDKIYQDPSLEKWVFTEAAHLFKESIATDFVLEYGFPKTTIQMEKYLDIAISKLMSAVVEIDRPKIELGMLRTTLQNIKNVYLPDLDPEIEISSADLSPETKFTPTRTQDGTMVQIQEKESTKVKDQLSVTEWLNTTTSYADVPNLQLTIDYDEVYSPNFGNISDPLQSNVSGGEDLGHLLKEVLTELNVEEQFLREAELGFLEKNPRRIGPDTKLTRSDIKLFLECLKPNLQEDKLIKIDKFLSSLPADIPIYYSVETVLSSKYQTDWVNQKLFSPHLGMTQNFMKTLADEINLLDKHEKPVDLFIVIKDQNLPPKLLLISLFDAEMITKHFEKGGRLPEGRQMWLLRPHGEQGWPGPTPYDRNTLLKDKEVVDGIVEANFFGGNLHVFENQFWQKQLKAWITRHNNPEFAISFFEHKMLQKDLKEQYLLSKTFRLLHSFASK